MNETLMEILIFTIGPVIALIIIKIFKHIDKDK
jgi:hypothetical protein